MNAGATLARRNAMRQDERDHMLLAILEPEDRAKLLSLVEEIIAEEVPTRDTDRLNAAAEAFELCGETKSDDVKIVALQIAAALRLRASGGALH